MASTHSDPQLPLLLQLPIEIRQQIYTYLVIQENVSHPLPPVGITSVSHRPPTTSLLLIHPTITSEIVDHFYSVSIWKIVLSHAFNFYRVDPNLDCLEACRSLRRIRRVELVFFQDILLLKEYPSFGLEKFSAEIRRRADRACDVLFKAPKLREVMVSWVDQTPTGGWEEKAKILEPLRKLASRVKFCIGEIIGPQSDDEQRFISAMQAVLDDCRVCGSKTETCQDDPCHLRQLAFDVRQERLFRPQLPPPSTTPTMLHGGKVHCH